MTLRGSQHSGQIFNDMKKKNYNSETYHTAFHLLSSINYNFDSAKKNKKISSLLRRLIRPPPLTAGEERRGVIKCGKRQSKDYQEKEEPTLSSLSDCIIFDGINPGFRWETTGSYGDILKILYAKYVYPVHASSLHTSSVCCLTCTPTSNFIWTSVN